MNKKTWTLKRYQELHEECIRRGFVNIKDKSERWLQWHPENDIDYIPSSRDSLLIKERIISKINNSTGVFHYNRKQIEKEDLINKLKGTV